MRPALYLSPIFMENGIRVFAISRTIFILNVVTYMRGSLHFSAVRRRAAENVMNFPNITELN